VTDLTTNLPASINGQWIVTNVTPTSFKLQGSSGQGESFSVGIWSISAGTTSYTLNFNLPSTSITSVSNPSGGVIRIHTASTAGLTNGQQITISGVTGQTGINGTWTIANVTATSFELVGITGNTAANGGPTGDGTPSTGGSWSPANALQFAQTVYDTIQTMSLLVNPETVASRSASLLAYVIGGNTGSFVINQGFKPITGRDTLLPDQRTALQLRDEIKSLLRGVYNFNAIPDQSQWYPNPATPTSNATLNGTAIKFGIYNLDPYVWFVHDVLHNSSYGFSFDDDVANAQAASSTLQIAVGGNAYTAPIPPAPNNNLPNHEAFAPWAQWGTQQSQGYIDTTSPPAITNAAAGQITISGLSQATVARLTASDPKKDHPGAYITSDSTGLLPAVVTIVDIRAVPSVSQAISSITNPSGTTIRINTANTGALGIGDLVTISGVTGQTAINARWVVTNVVKDTSFDLVNSIGDGTPSSGGAWTWDPSFVTFLKPTNYTPPTDNAKHQFTFSAFLGTTVPTNITSSVSQAPPGTVVTINGTGLTGVYGVSFNGYAGTLVGGAITSITNTSGNPIVIGAGDTTGLVDGDTVTISGVIDQTTGKPAAINRQWQITNVVTRTTNGSFQLTGNNSTGNGDILSGGNWIDGTDSAVKVIVPSFIPNKNGTTYPGPKGKVGVRNASGINYSSVDFTIGEATYTITVFAGSPQSAVVNTAFASRLQARVTNAGNPVGSGFKVMFVAPGSPASGTFAGGATTETVDTDASGVATSSVFTANGTAGVYTVTATTAGAGTPANFNLTNTSSSPATRVAFVQQPTSGLAGATIRPPVTVQVQDASGKPVGGPFTVTLALGSNPSGGVLGGTLTRPTNAAGLATFEDLTVSKPGIGYTLVASSAGLPSVTSAAFNETGGIPARASVAAFDPGFGTWYVRHTNSPGAPDVPPFAYGAPGWVPVSGDWDGNGKTTIGVFDPIGQYGWSPATWFLKNSTAPGAPDIAPFAYGAAGWIPVVGDWDGNGTVTIGVVDPATMTWYLRNSNSPGAPDIAPFRYGHPGWVPVVGDWDGDGKTTIGVFDPIGLFGQAPATWYLKNSNAQGAPDYTPFAYGGKGWKPVAGDWTGSGHTGIGVVDPAARWYLKNTIAPGAPDVAPFAYGVGTWAPVPGQWAPPRPRSTPTGWGPVPRP